MAVKNPFETELHSRGGSLSVTLPRALTSVLKCEEGDELKLLPAIRKKDKVKQVIGFMVIQEKWKMPLADFIVRLNEQNYKHNPKKRAEFMKLVYSQKPLDYIAWLDKNESELLKQATKNAKGERGISKILRYYGWNGSISDRTRRGKEAEEALEKDLKKSNFGYWQENIDQINREIELLENQRKYYQDLQLSVK